jgi:hypothetical protein
VPDPAGVLAVPLLLLGLVLFHHVFALDQAFWPVSKSVAAPLPAFIRWGSYGQHLFLELSCCCFWSGRVILSWFEMG